jgi:hypothetical protein
MTKDTTPDRRVVDDDIIQASNLHATGKADPMIALGDH